MIRSQWISSLFGRTKRSRRTLISKPEAEILETRVLLTHDSIHPDAIWYRADGDDDFVPPFPDHLHGDEDSDDGGGSAEFTFNDVNRWGRTATDGGGLQRGDATTLTWSLVPDGTFVQGHNGEDDADSDLIAFLGARYGVTTNDANFEDEPWFPLFEDYLNRWGEVTGLSYVYEPADDGAALDRDFPTGVLGVRGDIRISGHFIDGENGSNVLAYNFFPNIGDMVIDTGNPIFYGNTAGNSIRLRNVLSHEHGHGLGINHVCPLLGGADGRLMEPFINISFDGPQFDDILAAQRGYGDRFEKDSGNDTVASATDLGNLTGGSSIVIGSDAADARVSPDEDDFFSIDGHSDTDVYQFTVAPGTDVTMLLTPLGPSYLSGPQNRNGSCSNGTLFNAAEQSDLILEFLDSAGNVVASSNANGLGGAETIQTGALPAGDYYARIRNTQANGQDAAQMYELDLQAVSVPILEVETGDGLIVTEDGAMDSYTIGLNITPTGPVEITAAADADTLVSTDGVTFASTAVLTFTDQTAQTIFVQAVDDVRVEGTATSDIAHSITSTADPVNFPTSTDVDDVSATVVDNDTPSFSASPTSGLTVSEDGASTTFDVVLDAEPIGNVAIDLTGDNSEYSFSSPRLNFSPATWNQPQTVTLVGLEDSILDGDLTTQVRLAINTALTNDPFDSAPAIEFEVLSLDNDVAGLTISSNQVVVNESGSTETVLVRLDVAPVSNVILDVLVSDPTEVVTNRTSLTFTPSDWDTDQRLEITGADDTLLDGDIDSTVTLSVNAASSHPLFATLDDEIIDVTTIDDDTPRIMVTPDSLTIEEGNTGTVRVNLGSIPNSPVVVTFSVDDASELSVAPVELTFTPSDALIPQTITLNALDDGLLDGNVMTSIIASVDLARSDSTYTAADAIIEVTVNDSSVPSATVTPNSVTVSESGTQATFEVVLDVEPLGDVTFDLTGDSGEFLILDPQVTFTTANWNVPQTVTVQGADDDIVDGTVSSPLVLAIDKTNSHLGYHSLADLVVNVDVDDDELPAINVTPSNITVAEGGATADLTISLSHEPVDDVVVALTADPAADLTFSSNRLIFTPSNWNSPQTTTVSAFDDLIAESTESATVTVSIDAAASSLPYTIAPDETVDVEIIDNDGAGFLLSNRNVLVSEDGTSSSVAVRLSAEPLSDVIVAFVVDDPTEASISRNSLVFTPGNWNLNQSITITGADDILIDGTQSAQITASVAPGSDPVFSSFVDQVIQVAVDDNDTPAVNVSGGVLNIAETGTTQTFDIQLATEPIGVVTFDIVSSDEAEAVVDLQSVAFDPSNWDQPQTVTVTGQDDFFVDGTQSGTITIAIDPANSQPEFHPLADTSVTWLNDDDDVADLAISPQTLTVAEGLSDQFLVQLDARPTDDVVLSIFSLNPSEVTVVTSTLTFTTDNWDSPQPVVITGVDDDLIDGESNGTVVVSVQDADSDVTFRTVPDQQVDVTITNNDAPGVNVSVTGPTSISEPSESTTIEVVLPAEPASNVTFDILISDASEIQSNRPSITFTPANWNVPQPIVITAVDDPTVDGPQTVTVQFVVRPDISDDAFDSLPAETASLIVVDEDVAGFDTNVVGDNDFVEGTGARFVDVVLTAQPLGDVVFVATSNDETEATVTPREVTFTPATWNVPQRIFITAADDFLPDGNQSATISIAPHLATIDPTFESLTAFTVSFVNIDDEPGRLDFDQNGSAEAATDGILAIRHLFGFSGQPLVNNAVGAGAQNTTGEAVQGALRAAPVLLDVDGDGDQEAATDGILLIRYLLGFTGDVLVQNAVGVNATRTTGEEIIAFLDGFQPQSGFSNLGSGPQSINIEQPTAAPTFIWPAVDDADRYLIRIEDVNTQQTIATDLTTVEEFTAINLPSGQYRIWVQALREATQDIIAIGSLDFSVAQDESGNDGGGDNVALKPKEQADPQATQAKVVSEIEIERQATDEQPAVSSREPLRYSTGITHDDVADIDQVMTLIAEHQQPTLDPS